MTREKRTTIKILNGLEVCNSRYPNICKALENAIDAIKKESKWTLCSERLPEEIGPYIATLDYEDCGVTVGQRYYHGKQIGWDDGYVIAWMPFPKPYKAESEKVWQ